MNTTRQPNNKQQEHLLPERSRQRLSSSRARYLQPLTPSVLSWLMAIIIVQEILHRGECPQLNRLNDEMEVQMFLSYTALSLPTG